MKITSLLTTTAKAGALALGLLGISQPSATAQNIVFSGGGADLTFFYDSDEDTWDTVFRSKDDTVATGLTNPYGTPPGGVGGSANDFRFDTLTVSLTQPGTFELNSINYFITPASGGFFASSSQPDLGIRTRLREGDPAVDQFDNFRMTLDWANSTFNGGAIPTGVEFAMFTDDGFGSPVVNYETAASDFVHDWPAWGHDHWHWGFSQPGEYNLAFTFQGINGGNPDSSIGSTSVQFDVVPEPAAGTLLLLAAALFFLARRKQFATLRG